MNRVYMSQTQLKQLNIQFNLAPMCQRTHENLRAVPTETHTVYVDSTDLGHKVNQKKSYRNWFPLRHPGTTQSLLHKKKN